MKRNLFILSLLVICIAIVPTTTLAHFTASKRTHNVITTGSVAIAVFDSTANLSDNAVAPSENTFTGVMPTTTIPKRVTVQNTGSASAWVRMNIDISVQDIHGDPLPSLLPIGTDKTPIVSFRTPQNWTAHDGYFYYQKPLLPSETTSALLEELAFDSSIGNAYQGCTVNFTLQAQAVQVANNPVPTGGTVADVVGWPQRGGKSA